MEAPSFQPSNFPSFPTLNEEKGKSEVENPKTKQSCVWSVGKKAKRLETTGTYRAMGTNEMKSHLFAHATFGIINVHLRCCTLYICVCYVFYNFVTEHLLENPHLFSNPFNSPCCLCFVPSSSYLKLVMPQTCSKNPSVPQTTT